jgi:hypothetical protein
MSTESTAKKPFYKKWWFWVVLLIALAAIGKGGNGGGASPRGSASAAPIVLPPMEARLIEIASTAQFASRKANNDMQRGGIKSKRDKALCESITSLAIMDWIGTIKKIDSNSDGKGVLEIEIAPDILIKTWNNALSDLSDQTLLEPGSPVFETAATMKPGQKAIFSGTLLKGSKGECIQEGSISLHGKISEPEFIFRFSAISAYDPAKQAVAPPVAPAPPQPTQPAPTSTAPSISGTWKGSLEGNGQMEIKPTATGFDVALDVSNAECTGSIEGTGSLSGNTLIISKKEDDQVCTITIKFAGNTANIDENNCSFYHGMACGFSGTLNKVK